MAVGVALREDERVLRLDGMERCEQVLQNDHVDEAYSEKVNASLEKEEPDLGSSSSCFGDWKRSARKKVLRLPSFEGCSRSRDIELYCW